MRKYHKSLVIQYFTPQLPNHPNHYSLDKCLEYFPYNRFLQNNPSLSVNSFLIIINSKQSEYREVLQIYQDDYNFLKPSNKKYLVMDYLKCQTNFCH